MIFFAEKFVAPASINAEHHTRDTDTVAALAPSQHLRHRHDSLVQLRQKDNKSGALNGTCDRCSDHQSSRFALTGTRCPKRTLAVGSLEFGAWLTNSMVDNCTRQARFG